MKNYLLLCDIDREDTMLMFALSIELDREYENFQEVFENKDVVAKLRSKEVVDFVIDEKCLLSDLFGDDESYKFQEIRMYNSVTYVFVNDDGDEQEVRLRVEFTQGV